MTQVQETMSVFTQRFLEIESSASNQAVRKAAMDAFETLGGIPTPRHEEWKYTDVRALAKWTPRYAASSPAPNDSNAKAKLDEAKLDQVLASLIDTAEADLPAVRMVFVDGHFLASRSGIVGGDDWDSASTQFAKETGATLTPLSACSSDALGSAGPSDEFVFAALNTALHQDGGCLDVPAGTKVDRPVQFIHASTADVDVNVQHPRNLIVLGTSAEARVMEEYVSLGSGDAFTNPVTEFVLADNAHLDHYRFVQESNDTFHIATTFGKLGRDAQLVTNNINRGGRVVRNDLRVFLGGEGSGCVLNGLNIGTDQQLMDDHTAIVHAVPNCFSREFYKSVLDDSAQGVFNGKVFVYQDAQKTDGVQENKSLILSPKALMNTKPQLEIYADDVRCTHGATIGQLDRDAMFYLRSRGITAADARQILVHAFAHDIIERMAFEPARDVAARLLTDAVQLS